MPSDNDLLFEDNREEKLAKEMTHTESGSGHGGLFGRSGDNVAWRGSILPLGITESGDRILAWPSSFTEVGESVKFFTPGGSEGPRTLEDAARHGFNVAGSIGLGQAAGSFAATTVNPHTKKYIIGYHGSPYNFDRFSNKAINTGEGTQDEGWGHYIAEEPLVGDTYRSAVSYTKNHGDLWGIGDVIFDDFFGGIPQEMKDKWGIGNQPDFTNFHPELPVVERLRLYLDDYNKGKWSTKDPFEQVPFKAEEDYETFDDYISAGVHLVKNPISFVDFAKYVASKELSSNDGDYIFGHIFVGKPAGDYDWGDIKNFTKFITDVEELKKDLREIVAEVDNKQQNPKHGVLYSVRINKPDDTFMDLDKNLGELPEPVLNGLQKLPYFMDIKDILIEGQIFRGTHGLKEFRPSEVVDDMAAVVGYLAKEEGLLDPNIGHYDMVKKGKILLSEDLKKVGISGFRYLDSGSAEGVTKQQTRNYVVFDENDLEVTDKRIPDEETTTNMMGTIRTERTGVASGLETGGPRSETEWKKVFSEDDEALFSSSGLMGGHLVPKEEDKETEQLFQKRNRS